MVKKILAVLLVALLSVGLFVACGGGDNSWKKVRVGNEILYGDGNFIDYANEVFFENENDAPEMAEEGMFWTRWNTQNKEIDMIAADSEEGATWVDPDKPILIIVHGMLADGGRESFVLNEKITDTDAYGITDTEKVYLARLWLDRGWNVAYFHYNYFTATASEHSWLLPRWPAIIEEKIWSTDGDFGVFFVNKEKKTVKNASKYTIAEHFVAEYIRAFNLLPEKVKDNEIRVGGHSMGGEVSTAGIFLLTELAEAGQISHEYLPDRFAMLDPYFSVYTAIPKSDKYLYLGPKDIKVRWTGKGIYQNNLSYHILECLKDIVANGIVVEYYYFSQSFLNLAIPEENKDILKSLTVYVLLNPEYKSYIETYNITNEGHNGVNFWYYCSIAAPPVKDITDASKPDALAASASTPTSVIKELRGKAFQIKDGYSTVFADDDTFIPLD